MAGEENFNQIIGGLGNQFSRGFTICILSCEFKGCFLAGDSFRCDVDEQDSPTAGSGTKSVNPCSSELVHNEETPCKEGF